MLLRCASMPVLKSSWQYPHATKELFSEVEMIHPITRTRSLTLSASSFHTPPVHAASGDDSMRKIARVMSDRKIIEEEKVKWTGFGPWEAAAAAALEEDGCGGGRGGSVGGGASESWDANHGNNDGTDIYYQRMIEANPGNALLLGNYARFLKEVRKDFARAEGYCGRAILENPNDGGILSMYADLIWEGDKDTHRAESYFDQAVKAAPDDCYVLASFAHFLWDAEEGEEDEQVKGMMSNNTSSASGFLDGVPTPSPSLCL